MSFSHANPDPIAEAEVIQPNSAEADDVRDPRLFELYLDSDAKYRWYEEDEPSDAYAETLVDAIVAAEDSWDGFQLVELRGHAVESDTVIEDSYAADELEEIGGIEVDDLDDFDDEDLDDPGEEDEDED
jgi:hypothetical protein